MIPARFSSRFLVAVGTIWKRFGKNGRKDSLYIPVLFMIKEGDWRMFHLPINDEQKFSCQYVLVDKQ